MSTAEPNPVRTFDLTVLCAQGTFNPLFPTYVVVQIGEQRQRTKGRHGIKKPVWNETCVFTITTSIRDTAIKIRLYRGSLRKDDILLGETEEHLFACEPRNTDIVKGLERGGKTCGFNITFRIGETKFSGHRSRIQALVIGVNKYPRISQLKGCVNDALAMKALLSDRFHVPDDQIKLLLDKSATRDAILDYLQKGFTRTDCDTIVIYFAGHGSRIDTPPDWPSGDKKIETICPYDIGLKDLKTGKPICGIEDYRFNILLHKLAAEKNNNNITVILDSCHSAGASRDDDDASDGVRGVETTVPIPSDWKEVLASATASRNGEVAIPRNFRYNYLASHVLLAACGESERALEAGDSESKLRQGRFTTELVKYLYENSIDEMTNQQLIELLPQWSNQHPQCVGHHSQHILFDSKIVDTDMSSYALTVKHGVLQVGIGSVGGVVEGTEFTACLPDRPKLVATSVTAHSSILACIGGEYTFPSRTRVEVSNWKNDAFILRVFLSPESDHGLSRVLRDDSPASPLASGSTSALAIDVPRPARNFILADSQQTADIKLTIAQSDPNPAVEVVIDRLDPLTSVIDPSRTEFKLDISELRYLPHILNRVSHFHFNLRNYNPDAPFKDQIDVQFFELDRATDTPLPGNLFTNASPTSKPALNGHAHIIEDLRKRYGFRILNHSSSDVFPYLFYFDPREYQIKDWHSPNEAVLAPSDSAPTEMPVGFGAGGGFPFIFSVPSIPNVSSDTGFLKLFVSTERIPSLAHIEQMDPLKPQESARAGDRSSPMGGLWDVWIGAITVKRNEK